MNLEKSICSKIFLAKFSFKLISRLFSKKWGQGQFLLQKLKTLLPEITREKIKCELIEGMIVKLRHLFRAFDNFYFLEAV